jgi:hypothetical protein
MKFPSNLKSMLFLLSEVMTMVYLLIIKITAVELYSIHRSDLGITHFYFCPAYDKTAYEIILWANILNILAVIAAFIWSYSSS